MLFRSAYTAIEDRRKYEYGEDKKGNPLYAEYDLETIRRLKKEAYEAGEDIPAVCNEISLKVLKSRFTEAERRANLIFDGKHSTFKQVALKYQADAFTSGNGWTPYTGTDNPFEE